MAVIEITVLDGEELAFLILGTSVGEDIIVDLQNSKCQHGDKCAGRKNMELFHTATRRIVVQVSGSGVRKSIRRVKMSLERKYSVDCVPEK